MAKKVPNPEEFAHCAVYAKKMRSSMLKTMRTIKDKRCAVFLSSGVDSNACLAAVLESGLDPTIYSATINGCETQDFRCARATASLLGLRFVAVNIQVDLTYVKKYLAFLIGKLRPDLHKNKTTIETSFIVFEMIKAVKERYIVSGFYGDAYFATLRSLKKKYLAGEHDSILDGLLKLNVTDSSKCKDIQHILRLAFAQHRKRDIQFVLPYAEPSFIAAARGMDPIKDGCKPIQKAPLRFAFYDHFVRNKDNVYIHVAMQKGDLKADDLFKDLLVNSDWNIRGHKSAVGVYNDLELGRISFAPRKTLF